MNVRGLTRLIPVGWKGETRALVGLLADHHAFEASEARRAEIARRADALLAAPTLAVGEARDRKFDLASSDWKTRADAAARLSSGGAWTSWTVAGSLGDAGPAGIGAEARLASAILIAARETLLPDISARQSRLIGPAGAALVHEKDGARVWDDALRPLVAEFAGNARRNGADRRTAALQALAAAAHLKGRALQDASVQDAFLLGAAASPLLREKDDEAEDGAPSAMEELARRVAELNDARGALWDDGDGETARRMGAAAAIAAFGRGSVSAPVPHPCGARGIQAHLPVESLRKRARLAASEAAEAIEDEASDPRLDDARRRRLESICDELRRHPAAHAVSCADALGMETPEATTAALQPGMKVYRTAPEGRRPLVCAGRNGRAVRCRPVAGPDGASVGYLAFDALSREFKGRPLYAVYALDGSRYGYAWADGRPVVRRGEPEQGFMTAPETIRV